MKRTGAAWQATIELHRRSAPGVERLELALRPEAAREVPRSRSTLRRAGELSLTIEIEAADTGALRAALNTYLGWIGLALAAERVAFGGGATPTRPTPEAVKSDSPPP